MIAFGILFLIAGIGSAIYGSILNNDMNAQLNSILGRGVRNPGDIWIYCGAAVALIGATLVICGVIRSAAKGNNEAAAMENPKGDASQGGEGSPKRVFHSEEEREQAIQRIEIAMQNGAVSANEYTRLRAEMVAAPLVGIDTGNATSVNRTAQSDSGTIKHDDVEEYKNRVAKLKFARENGLISEEEFQRRAAKLVDEI